MEVNGLLKSDKHLISPYYITPWITHQVHKNQRNDHQLKTLLTIKLTLLVSTLRNVKRTVWRLYILMLGCKGLNKVYPLFNKPLSNLSWIWLNLLGCLQNEDQRPKNEDPNFFARIRHGQLKNQAQAFLSANRCENNGDLRFVDKTPWIYKTKTLTKMLCQTPIDAKSMGSLFCRKSPLNL